MATALLYSVVSMVIVLGIMIVVHEFGHFAAAKLFGVRVEVFSVGFGKRILGFRRGETDYRISLLPLGGYVKMAGENPMEARTGDPGEFMSHPRWQRLIIAVAGPAMNIVLAVALLTGVFMAHYEHPIYLDQPAIIGWVLENSAAEKAGFQAGDRIVRIGGTQNPTWEEVIPRVMLSPNQPVEMAVQRGNEILSKTITPESNGPEQFGNPGWLPEQPNTVTETEPDMPAAKAGIQVGDEIVAINGIAVRSTPGMARQLQETKDQPVTITALRGGREMKFNMIPVLTEIDGRKQYRVGVRSEPQHVDKLPFTQAVAKSVDQNKKNSMLILELVQKMMQRKVSIKQMEGPIGIARASGQAAQEAGWTPLLGLMAAISLNLGIFNLFPIPILDGGLILLLLIESLMRRDISQRIKERIYQAAFVCLILFAGLVIFNDVMKALPGLTQHIQ
ncbi:MAG TPA: site-2 protease family protein [Clostridia bacterium]|nr:site-2 protease family protein [Clostridia bacterium]